jgi:DNA-binding NtrC family response regulator
VKLHVPALRERIEDIPPLIDHFLTIFAARYRRERKGIARDALRRLSAYHWPGNVRQLEHVLLNAWLMSEEDEIATGDLDLPAVGPPVLPAAIANARTNAGASSPPPPMRAASAISGAAQGVPGNQAEFKANERERILSALAACNWNRVQAAKMIGVPRRTFYRRLKEFGIL